MKVDFKRIPGEGTMLTVHLDLRLDTSDASALDRLGRVMRELIPEEDRAQFLAALEAARAAVFLVELPPS